MAASFPTLFPRGFRLINGQALNKLFNGPFSGLSVEDTITAKAGGTKAAAYQLTASLNRISVCATATDSVKLHANPAPGSQVTIINDGAQSAQVFGANNDTIDGVVTATGVAQAAAKRVDYYCLSVSSTGVAAWYSNAGTKTT